MKTAMFSLINRLFLRGLLFAEPSRIIHIHAESKESNIEQGPISVPKYWQYCDAQTVFTEIAADAGTAFILTGMGDLIQVFGANVATLVDPIQRLRTE